MDQRGGHVDELGAEFDVEFGGVLHVLQILLRDGSDGDVVDIDFLLADEVEQQIERAVVLREVKIQRG